MTVAIFLVLIGIGLTILLIFLMIRSNKAEAKKLVKSEEEGLHAIVHELRAPVVAIKDSASLMLSQSLNPDEQKNMLNLIHDQSTKLIEQISTILDSAKVQDGKFVLRKSMGDLGQVVKDDIALFAAEAKRKNITLSFELDSSLPTFSFDQIRITEVLSNLISNSLKYTNEGGKIYITVAKKDSTAVVMVSDTGTGIPPEKQKMLFQKFSNLNDGAEAEKAKISSGLGLFITKGIIDAHQGKITVESTVGKGTKMTFSLPLDAKETAQPQPQQMPPHPTG